VFTQQPQQAAGVRIKMIPSVSSGLRAAFSAAWRERASRHVHAVDGRLGLNPLVFLNADVAA